LLSPGDLMTKDLPQPNPACSAWSHKFVFECPSTQVSINIIFEQSFS
jgi:hypothetical protein